MSQTQVQYGQSYAESLRELPTQIQSKVNKCISQLLRDMNNPGLHVENLSGQRKSARIDDKYRLIFTGPEKGVFCLLFAGPHDTAYRAAKVFKIPTAPAPATSKIAFRAEPESFVRLSLPKTTKYLPLYTFLAGLSHECLDAKMTFSEIEQKIDAGLPASARRYSAWWANDHSRHVQASAWLAAGWETRKVDLAQGTVVFMRRA